MKILIATGAFKQSLTSHAAAAAVARGLRRSGLAAELVLLPIADGGNGTLDAFLFDGGERRVVPVRDPLGRPVEAAFGLIDGGRTAVIEMALASGLELLRADELAPLHANTYGTGQLIQAALDAGAQRIIVGCGGSATTDGGAGCLQALGLRLLDADDRDLPPGPVHLFDLRRIDASALDSRWRTVELIVATDVETPVLGVRGAAAVFGPQKGATPADVDRLESALRYFFTQVVAQTGVEVRAIPGSGAAGALSGGLIAFLNARLRPGIDLILEQRGFDAHLRDAALVITSEGRLDAQTIYGKGPFGVARRAAAQGVKTVALVGGLGVDDDALHAAGLWAALPIVDAPMPLSDALARAESLVEAAALRLGYLLQIGGGQVAG